MSYLFILKRFEIWLLLGIVVALLVFAFQPIEEAAIARVEVADDISKVFEMGIEESQSDPEAVVEPTGFQVTAVKVEPTEQGQVVEVTLLARAKSEEPVFVTDETLKASTGDGLPIPHFFAPFQTPQSVSGAEESLVTVKLWMAHSADSIWLDFQGDRAKAELPGES